MGRPGSWNSRAERVQRPNIGCNAVDANGFCTGGIYPSFPGALDLEDAETVIGQNTSDYGPVIFVRRVDVPRGPETVDARIKITADNGYDLVVNGTPVGVELTGT